MRGSRASSPAVDSTPSRRQARLARLVHGLLAGLLVALVYLSGLTAALDRRSCDLWFQLSPTSDRPAQHTVLVAIDDASLANPELGGWRWSSRQLAHLLRAVSRAKPAAIGLDILLNEYRDDTDPELAAALSGTHRVVVAANLHDLGNPATASPAGGPASLLGPDRVGFTNAVADRSDGYVRSWQLVAQNDRATLFSFPVLLALAASGQRVSDVRVVDDRVLLPAPRGARSEWPLVTPIDYRRPGRLPTLSAADVIEDPASSRLLAGKVVLIGGTARGIFTDIFRTPLSEDVTTGESAPTHGVEILAAAVETLLSGALVREVPPLAGAALAFAFVLLACLLLRPLPPVWGAAAALLLAIASAAACLALFVSARLQMPVTPFVLGATAAFVVVALEKHAAAEAQRRLAEHRNALLRDLSAMVTHDLTGPLLGATGFLELLSQEPLTERQRGFLHTAIGSTKWLGLLVAGILDVARLEAGQLLPHREALDLRRELEEALSIVRYQLQEKGLRAEVAVPADLPVSADSALFRRIVANLVGNAAKFSPVGGTIRLEARADPERNATVVSVQDHGPGIARDQQGRIFDKFVQVTKGQGAETISVGLGLAFCRLAAEAHGGGIWVASEPGQGACFSFWLPLAAPEARREGRRRPRRARRSPESAADARSEGT